MALTKLEIVVEAAGKAGSRPVFDQDPKNVIAALFNPNQLVFSKNANWKKQDAKGHDVPELQFTSSDPRTLNVDLLFDTYDTPDATKKDVRTEHTDAILKLTMVDGDKHRPRVCRLRWGSVGYFFQGVLEKLEQRFTLFMEDGTPARAKLTCTFTEWWTNEEDLKRQARESSDIAKVRTVKRGESLSSIAAEAYLDPAQWRPIARANGIDDPRRLIPGTVLLIPALPKEGVSLYAL